MSGLDPKGPAQPTLDQSYETRGNPASKAPAEQRQANANAQAPAGRDQRVPTQQSSSIADATSSSLGRGVRGAPPGEEAKGYTSDEQFTRGDVDGEQMRAPGEGDVTRAVHDKPGAGGEQADFASDLDKKKAEQAPLRNAMKEERAHNVDVAGVLGQRGGPANPVDQNNYPNSGD